MRFNMIYLDNAATTFPKPEGVSREVKRCLDEYCGNPGRSSHAMSVKSAEKIYDCRVMTAEMFGAPELENVVFTLNTTYAINFAVRAFIRDGDHVLIGDIEHNSVYRPVAELARNGRITFDIFESGDTKRTVRDIISKIRPETKAVICAHQSNICGITEPIREIGSLCRQRGIKFVVDAAQSAGLTDIDVIRDNITALCIPGHKSLYGVQGSGAIIFGDTSDAGLVFEGGNGVNSLESFMPDFLPERYEVGTLPTPAIAGLCEGIKFVMRETPRAIAEREARLGDLLLERLLNDKNIKVYAPRYRSGTVLFNVVGVPSSETGQLLNDSGICVRSGFHCSPLAHKKLGTGDAGAVRVSIGAFNTPNDILALSDALYDIIKNRI